MTIEEERRRIMELWNRLEAETKLSLAFMWEHRQELGELEARVERLEPKVIKLLEVIPTLKKHSPEYHAHTVQLIKLIHHIEPTEEWMQKIREDLEFISGEIQKVKEAIRNIRLAERQIETFDRLAIQSYQLILEQKTAPLTPICLEIDFNMSKFSELEKEMIVLKQGYSYAPFMAFLKEGAYGLLFPNANIEYTESMTRLFFNLTRENWRKVKPKITPVKIIQISTGIWKVA